MIKRKVKCIEIVVIIILYRRPKHPENKTKTKLPQWKPWLFSKNLLNEKLLMELLSRLPQRIHMKICWFY